MTYEEALEFAMEGEVVFIIGSGFSTGARNIVESVGDEKKLWVGSKLASKMAELTEMDQDVQLDIVSQEYIDIFGEEKLIKYLKEHYTVSDYEEYYKVFSRIDKLKIYSTNYDDLIEKVCVEAGNKIKGYDTYCDIRKVNKDKMVMHLNGFVRSLTDDILPDSFKLTHLSYNNTEFFTTPWYAYLIEELSSAKAIFIIGLSFSSDLDIRRIISDETLKKKVFVIEREDISEANIKFIKKYGRPVLCGVKGFCEDLSKQKIPDKTKIKKIFYKSFAKIVRKEKQIEVTDKDVYNLFFEGRETDALYQSCTQTRTYQYLIERTKVDEVITGLKQNKSFIIYSDLGNGKSIFINQIADKCPELEFYYLKQVINGQIIREIKSLCENKNKKVIICDPVNLYIDILNKFADFDLSNIVFIFVARSSMYDNYYNKMYEVIEKMQNVQFMNPIYQG